MPEPLPDVARRPSRATYWAAVAGVYLGAAALMVYPSLFIAMGAQAIGAEAGWWAGDPNTDLSEGQISLVMGGLMVAVIVTGVTLLLWLTARTFRQRLRGPVILGAVLVVSDLAAVCVWVLIQVPPAG